LTKAVKSGGANWLLPSSVLRREPVVVLKTAENRDLHDRSANGQTLAWPCPSRELMHYPVDVKRAVGDAVGARSRRE
jgi:hypothetical protein